MQLNANIVYEFVHKFYMAVHKSKINVCLCSGGF